MLHHSVWEGMVFVSEIASVYRLALVYITDAFKKWCCISECCGGGMNTHLHLLIMMYLIM